MRPSPNPITKTLLTLRGAAIIVTLASSINVLAIQGPATAPPPTAPAGNSDNGKRIFVKYGCAECHGREGQGAPLSGPRIGPAPLALPAFVKYVRTPTGQMPPYTEKVVTSQELTDIRAFLVTRPRPPAAAQAVLPPE